jgi:hypothetical protein
MAVSTCVKCGNTVFEVVEKSPKGSNFKLMFVQCSMCGGAVGVTDFFNIGEMLRELGKKLNMDLT